VFLKEYVDVGHGMLCAGSDFAGCRKLPGLICQVLPGRPIKL
jgi:hypothetical protein